MAKNIRKTDQDRLADATDLIRQKNAQLLDQKRTIDQIRRENDTAEKIRQEIFSLAAHTCDPPEWVANPRLSSGTRGTPVAFWSDWHYGETVDPDQVGGVNAFNKKIALARVKLLTDLTIELCFDHMGRATKTYPGIVVALGGDFIGGDIHEDLLATNDRTPHQSVHDLVDIVGGCVEKLASAFGHVFLPCVVGNHGRSTRKPPTKNLVYTNYDWSLYCSLERDFRRDKRIRFMVPSESDAYFSVYNHRYLLTHGDNIGVKGGDGIIGAIGPIMRGAMKVGRSEAQIGRDFDTLLIGHWHEYMTPPGIIVNGTLKGYDEYARLRLRARAQRPTQALWLTHPNHGVTISGPIYLEPKKVSQQSKTWVSWQAA